jgi:hypothetical protein
MVDVALTPRQIFGIAIEDLKMLRPFTLNIGVSAVLQKWKLLRLLLVQNESDVESFINRTSPKNMWTGMGPNKYKSENIL